MILTLLSSGAAAFTFSVGAAIVGWIFVGASAALLFFALIPAIRETGAQARSERKALVQYLTRLKLALDEVPSSEEHYKENRDWMVMWEFRSKEILNDLLKTMQQIPREIAEVAVAGLRYQQRVPPKFLAPHYQERFRDLARYEAGFQEVLSRLRVRRRNGRRELYLESVPSAA